MENSIRRIYDLLENNSPRQALSACQKQLRKTPASILLQALQAFSLASLGREEEANSIVDAVLKTDHSDPSILNALAMTLKRLHRSTSLCSCYAPLEQDVLQLYEKAWALFPGVEDLGIEYFYSCIRSLSFKKANMAALRLHKKTGNNKYFIWAILSLYNQGQFLERKENEATSMELVQKMILRAVHENRLESFQEYSLCLLLPEKDESAFDSLFRVPASIFPSPIDEAKWRVQLLMHQKKFAQVVSYFRENPASPLILDDWELMATYLEACVSLAKADGMDVSSVFYWPSELVNSPQTRSCSMLARVEFYCKLPDSPNLDASMLAYFKEFGSKESCFAYLLPYAASFSSGSFFQDYISEKCPLLLDRSSTPFLQKTELGDFVFLINALKFSRYFSLRKGGSQDSPSAAVDYMALYELGRASFGCPFSDLLVLECLDVIKSGSVTSPDGAIASVSSSSLLQAASLLSYGLEHDDSNFYLKLLLLFVVKELGGVSIASEAYRSLNIKFIQLDMLSYILFDWIPLIGFNHLVQDMCRDLSTIYQSNELETPDLLAEGYRHASFSQVPEFVDFYLQLRHSIQKKILEITQIQADILGLSSKQAMLEYFKALSLPPLFKTVVDNRPLDELFSTWSAFPDFQAFIRRSTPKDTSWIETCYAILSSMAACFGGPNGLAAPSSPAPQGTEVIGPSQIESLLKDLTLEENQLEPLIHCLLSLVNSVYSGSASSFSTWFMKTCTVVLGQLQELASLSPSSLSPDAVLVKTEGLVEMAHYLTVFLVGVSHSQSVLFAEHAESRNGLLRALRELVPKIQEAILNFAPTLVVSPFARALSGGAEGEKLLDIQKSIIEKLQLDWAAVSLQSQECLRVCASILDSL